MPILFTSKYQTNSTIESIENAPFVEGKFFEGWYTDSAFTNKVEFPYTITADTKFFANYNYGTLEAASYSYDEESDSYIVVQNTTPGYTLPEIVIIPDVYNDGVHGDKPVTKVASALETAASVLGNNAIVKEVYFGNLFYTIFYPETNPLSVNNQCLDILNRKEVK